MFCPNCGSQVDNNESFCRNCGYDFNKQRTMNRNSTYNPSGNEGGSFWFNLLSFFSLIAGVIIFFIFKDDDPVIAKNAIKWAGISIIVKVIATIIFYVVYFAIFLNHFGNAI